MNLMNVFLRHHNDPKAEATNAVACAIENYTRAQISIALLKQYNEWYDTKAINRLVTSMEDSIRMTKGE